MNTWWKVIMKPELLSATCLQMKIIRLIIGHFEITRYLAGFQVIDQIRLKSSLLFIAFLDFKPKPIHLFQQNIQNNTVTHTNTWSTCRCKFISILNLVWFMFKWKCLVVVVISVVNKFYMASVYHVRTKCRSRVEI